MGSSHPFRFGAILGAVQTRKEWVEQLRMAEDLGYDIVLCTDHFTQKLAPTPALASAAERTRLRIGTIVLGNDFRHPALVAKEAASLDVISEGRFELGIGAGWARADYEPVGLAFDPPGRRIERLAEAVEVIRRCWAPGPFSFAGEHYHFDGYEGFPKPIQDPIPVFMGGGGPRMLRLAGRCADIVGISLELRAGTTDQLASEIGDAGTVLDRRIGWIREGAGERFDELELNVLLFGVEIGTPDGWERLARRFDTTPEAATQSPHLVAGSVEEVCELLQARRARFGINYLAVNQANLEAMGPVVERLSGT